MSRPTSGSLCSGTIASKLRKDHARRNRFKGRKLLSAVPKGSQGENSSEWEIIYSANFVNWMIGQSHNIQEICGE